MADELAIYAANHEQGRGRLYPDDSSPFRNEYQRDRDRIIHSSAFRRLEYKTQVFVNHEGDMFRTRLTHSIEVAQIGRTIARALNVNEDLTEAICLAHDLGHTPFGHAGQDALNKCMQDYGGFEHNLQSLRIVDQLEKRYASFPGLNLTYETREGIVKHCSRNNARLLGELGERFLNNEKPGLEAQIANIADEIAYNNHDIDDGLRAGLLTIDQLRQCELVEMNYQPVSKNWKDLDDSCLRHEIIRRMINYVVSDLINTSQENIREVNPETIEAVRKCGETLVLMSEPTAVMHKALKVFLRANLYQHKKVKRMADQAKNTVAILFDSYIQKPELMNNKLKDSIRLAEQNEKNIDLPRIIADYIAGMTDRFAFAELDRITV